MQVLRSSTSFLAFVAALGAFSAPPVVAYEQVAEVVGVVTAVGSSASAEDEDEWSLSFSLRPWRIVGAPRVMRELKLRGEGLNEAQLREQMDQYPADAIVRVRVRLRSVDEKSPASAPAEGDLIGFLGREPDDREMNEWVSQRARPVVVKDATLGTLTLDRSVNTYQGERKYRNRRYRLFIDRGSDDDDTERDRKLIESRRAVVRTVEAAVPAYLEAVADELLDLYNDTWRDSAPAIDRKAFMQRLSLDTLNIDEDGSWTVYLDDGGLFLGHVIQVSVEADGEVADVDLAG